MFRHVIGLIGQASIVWLLGIAFVVFGGLKLAVWLLEHFFALWVAVLGR